VLGGPAATLGGMSSPGDVPPAILDRLRSICAVLSEVYEEPAWIGVRWRIRTRTFAHVYSPDPDRYPVYAPYVTDGEGPIVMTFRAPVEDLRALTGNGFPYFKADWGHNVVGAVLGEHTDWAELAELIADSYCEMAPKFLVARVVPKVQDDSPRN
jgi:YjbR protein